MHFCCREPEILAQRVKVGEREREREREREKLIERRWLLVEHNHSHKSPIAKKKNTGLIARGKEHGRIWH